jgi:hypothetical protein
MWSSLEGLVVGGRYELGGHIATGGMAVVFKGWDHRVERPVAIKMLRQLEHATSDAVSRFQREAHAVATLNHPNVVRAYDFFEEHGCAYLVMELVDGPNLKQWLRHHGRLQQVEAIEIAEQVCAALAAAHARGFIHRDIKPQNILLDPSGPAKVADFGIVHIRRGATLTADGMVLGTADYIAPEQARGEDLTPATDVYALGVVLYETLTGQVPFSGSSPMAVALLHATEPVPPPSRVIPTLSPTLEAVVLRALHKQPARRYQSASAFALALRLARETLATPHEDACLAERGVPSGPPRALARVAVPALAGVAASVASVASVGALANPTEAQPGTEQAPPRVTAVAAADAEHEAVADAGEHWCDVAAILLGSAASPGPAESGGSGEDVAASEPESAPAVAEERGAGVSWLRLLVVAVTALTLLGGTVGLELWLNVHAGGMGLLPLP